MTAKVVDASALAAVAFEEAEAGEVLPRLKGHELLAPALLNFELANTCLKKLKREPTASRETILDQYRLALRLPVKMSEIDFEGVVPLAQQHNISAYDASYLWLARALGVELVTLDDKLNKAAAKP